MEHSLKTALFAAVIILAVGCSQVGDEGSTRPAPNPDSQITVFENIRILTMNDREVLENANIVVDGGKISAIKSTADYERPDGAVIIDGTDKTIMPGLADMHVHYFSANEGPLFLANSVTTVRNLWGSAETFRLDAKAKAGKDAGPHIYTSGPLMDGPEPIWGAGAIEILSPDMAIGAVESQRANGYAAVKLYAKLSAESYKAAASAAKERDMQIWTHVPYSLSIDEVLEIGVDSIEHLDGYADGIVPDGYKPPAGRGQSLAKWASADLSKLQVLVNKTADAGVWNSPTFSVVYNRYDYARDAEKYFNSDVGKYIGPGLKSWWSSSAEGLASLSARADEAVITQRAFVKSLGDAGAGLLIGTDTPNPFVAPGFSIHDELANFSAAGFTNEEILELATINAARFLGEEEVFGNIIEGSRADLVLINTDPRDDLNALRNPDGVMMNGHWYDREELALMLGEVETRVIEETEKAAQAEQSEE